MSLYNNHEPIRTYPDVTNIKNDKFDKEHMLAYLHCILESPRHRVNTSPELNAFNKFAMTGIRMIIQTGFEVDRTINNNRSITPLDKRIKTFRLRTTFTNADLDTPKSIDRSGNLRPRNPDDDRITNDSYFADLHLTANISITAHYEDGTEETKETTINRLSISSIPIMIRSSHCNTYKLPTESLRRINEDPTDTGGYFIAAGKEYVINATENLTFNTPLIFKSTLKTQKVYATMLSQRGGIYGNSTQITIYLNADDSIAIELQTYQFAKVKIPFYVLYRMFGVSSDKEIAKMIVYEQDQGTSESNKMLNYVTKAFLAEYKIDKKITQMSMNASLENIFIAIQSLADPNAYKKDNEAIRFVINDMREKLDYSVLPHIGTRADSRDSKLLHIGSLIRDSIMVDMGLRQEDDRDHYANKRGHGPAISLAKTTKTLINNKLIQPIQHALIVECVSKPFDTINIGDVANSIRSSVQGNDLQNAFIKYINASEREGTRIKEKIRMSAQALERKNKLNVCLALRQIISSPSKVAKTTKRGDRIRYYHTSAVELICPCQTPETGDKVGTVKQLAITAFITDSEGENVLFKEFVLRDTAITKITKIDLSDIAKRFLAKVYVDGEWIGVCKDPYLFVKRYRLLRREGVIDKHTSIEWDTIKNVIAFWMDLGRLMRPLLIVDNNLDDFNSGKADKFVQNILLSHDDIEMIRKGKMVFQDLINMGYVEYIYPGEEVLLCPSIEHLRRDRNDFTKQWTHCSIEQALFGLAALVGPFLNRNQSFRNTMVTIHSKQACGQPMTNAHTATRRQQRFHMHRVHCPLVKTLVKEALPPNSTNAMVLYAIFLGYNQEDSSMVNKGSVERGYAKGVYFKMDSIEIEKNQTIRIPKEKETLYMKNLSYAKLAENGIVPVGTTVQKGDILVGRVVELSTPMDDGKRYIDRSVAYDNEEPGRVVSIIKKLEGEDKFISCTFEYDRDMSIGDKQSSRSGNKNIIGCWVPQQDLPHTRDGLRPDIILNPASIPTRMTLAQLFETSINKLNASRGQFTDGTVYTKFDIHELVKELEKEGLGVREQMINGITGEMFDTLLFYGPQTTFRLPKFVKEDRHAVGRSGPKNLITGQPLTGKRLGGGHKVGEMEQWVMLAQGSIYTLFEEFYYDSDKREIYVCRGCNDFAIYNNKLGKYKCKTCGELADIAMIDSSKTSSWFLQQLCIANIKIKLKPEERIFEEYMDPKKK
uniref:DNA-directed RNA polymerase n=1 Tax=viral metagenome TaxID=1070528 RepID=A0A6C0LLU2_9ZZZZ